MQPFDGKLGAVHRDCGNSERDDEVTAERPRIERTGGDEFVV